ncbi:pyruvate, water dikinase regulatory protein [Chengkuizengella marina]|uniref:Putative pyruvate, phosphate dikinase regulatory protein n=1 Tax=Chengkuizengella marina TaxID=2507566 RepID=A0A6N9Q4Z7_9BACL|nr:pyruvate, water dikinase regulatory protein [Chengkuizengella marina]NBI29925.1 kinase/pyrophosphorylase [Chengkuizengella marina]
MVDEKLRYKIFICSDSIGETAETVVKATARQFDMTQIEIKRVGHIQYEDQIKVVMEDAYSENAVVAYTLVQPELREMMKQEAIRLGVRAVDIMGPMMQAFIDTFNNIPKQEPGLLHKMDENYFKKVEAIEFAVKFDDGRDVRGLLQAELVLVGISRTSKTPLSIFLAHKGIKVANLPLVPEVKPPKELFEIPRSKVIGLTMQPEQILRIRKERLKALGMPSGANYATLDRIIEEHKIASDLMKRVGCPIIDVTERAIEETAAIIISLHDSNLHS